MSASAPSLIKFPLLFDSDATTYDEVVLHSFCVHDLYTNNTIEWAEFSNEGLPDECGVKGEEYMTCCSNL